MRTTIEIPDALFREVKSRTGREGTTLKRFFTEAVREKLARTHKRDVPLKFPIVPKGQLGSVKSLTGADIERIEIDELLGRR
ncbi:MAG: hypothetical protein SFV18_11215 [Bryobacteraceae bacterium]|nr:hypothetical protein [Bryobacteraceae bacterium]